MKFIHTGDLHLSRNFKNINMSHTQLEIMRNELWDTLDKIVEIALTETVDAILFCGDLFEREYFTISDIKRFRDVLTQLTCEIIIISGNHDYISKDSMYLKIKWPNNFHIFKDSDIKYIDMPNIQTRFHGSSWVNNIMRSELDYSSLSMHPNFFNIFLAHGTVVKNTDYLPIDIKKLEHYNFDYIALGHIHKNHKVGDNAYYCGSPHGFGFNELGSRGVNLVELNKTSRVSFVPLHSRQYLEEIIELKPSMNYVEVKNAIIRNLNTSNIYRIILKGSVRKDIDIDTIIDNITPNLFYSDVVNNLESNINIEEIYEENKDNIKGLFIKELNKKGLPHEKYLRVLNYGLKALEKGDY